MSAGPILRKRIQILAASLIGSGLLAALHHGTQAPQYVARAEFLLHEESLLAPSSEDPPLSEATSDHLSLLKQLVTGDLVLDRVIESLPEAHHLDWSGVAGVHPRDILRENLNLSAIPGESAFRVSCRSRQPETAVVILEEILDFTHQTLHSRENEDSSVTVETLARECEKLQQQSEAKEAEWRSLAREFESRFGTSMSRAESFGDTGSGLFQALEEAQRQHREAKMNLVAVETSMRNGWEVSALEDNDPEIAAHSLTANEPPENLSPDPTLAEIRQRSMALEARLQDLLRRYGPAHSRVREIDEQIRHMQNWLSEQSPVTMPAIILVADHDLVSDPLSEARAQLQRAKAHEDSIREQYELERSHAIERENHLARIAWVEHELGEVRTAHAAILEQMQQSQRQHDQSPEPLLTITLPPEAPGEPSAPNLTRSLCIFQGAGLLVGLGVIVLGERRTAMHRAIEHFAQSLSLPVLGAIGELSATGGSGLDAVQTWARLDPAETAAFERLRTYLESCREPACLAITSGIIGEGKTTLAANLAVEFAQAGKTTLLIDADLSGKGLSRLLELDAPRGLSSILSEKTSLAECARNNIVPTLQPGLDMLPAGPDVPVARALWEGTRWREFVCWAERVYDQVLIDGPAISSDAEAEMIAQAASGVLLVINPKEMSKPTIDALLERWDSANLAWLGIVASRVSVPLDVQDDAFAAESKTVAQMT